jgi:hypothetical protein
MRELMNDKVQNEEIEKHIPSFLWYQVVDDPLFPKIHFRFGDYALAVAWKGDTRDLNDVSPRLRAGLPLDHQKIWDFLESGETTSQVMLVNKKMTGVTYEPQGGNSTEHDFIHFRLRGASDGVVKAAYVEEYDMIVISDNYKSMVV